MSAGKNERGRQDDLFDFLQSYELENNNSQISNMNECYDRYETIQG